MKEKGVLIVDDARFVRNKLKQIIEKLPSVKVVGEASNGEEAVSLYKDLKPDLVTMDLVMPNIDGIKAIEKIMNFDEKANILVVSAMGQEASVLEATEKGAKDFIKKPFKGDQVSKVIERLLRN